MTKVLPCKSFVLSPVQVMFYDPLLQVVRNARIQNCSFPIRHDINKIAMPHVRQFIDPYEDDKGQVLR